MGNKKQIRSLQGWRAIMMFVVVMGHLFGINIIFGGAGEAMSFFFILSGFVLSLAFGDIFLSLKVNEVQAFVKKRLSKIYPLYIVMLLFCFLMYVGFAFLERNSSEVLSYIKYLVVDSMLLQAWIPIKEYYMSLNGVAWFLSALMFSYVMFIPTNFVVNKIKNKSFKMIYFAMALVLITLVVYELICKNVGVHQYFTYVFPIYRYLEFTVGMFLAEIFKRNRETKTSKMTYTVVEIAIIVYFIVEYIVGDIFSSKFGFNGIISLVQLFIMCTLIYVFSFEKGLVSKIISNKLFLAFASISFEVYLIHQAFQNAIGAVLSRLGLPQLTGIVTVIATLVMAVLWKRITIIVKKRKQHRG